MNFANAGMKRRHFASVLTVVVGIAAISVTTLTLLFGLDSVGLIELDSIQGYPVYQLK